MTMHKALYSRDDIDTLYVSRKEEESGYTSIVDSMVAAIRGLKNYTIKSKGRLITAASTKNIATNKTTITMKQK